MNPRLNHAPTGHRMRELWIALTLWLIVALLAYQLVHAGPWYFNLSESPVAVRGEKP